MFRRYIVRDLIYIFKSKFLKTSFKRKKVKYRLFLFLLIVVGTVILSFSVFENKIKPTIIAMAESKAKRIALQAINEAVSQEIIKNIKYEDLITIIKDDHSRVTAVRTNVVKMNEIQSATSQVVQDKIAGIEVSELKIPIGNIFNSSILAGLGPKIKIKILPVGSVQSKFIDDFVSAGINQTKHKIFMEIKGNIVVIVPLIRIPTEVISYVPIAETIIVGDVPNTFLDVSDASPEEKKKATGIAENLATQ